MGPMTGEAFRAYVEQVLAPALEPGDVVAMDNLAVHKVAGVPRGDPGGRGQRALPPVLFP